MSRDEDPLWGTYQLPLLLSRKVFESQGTITLLSPNELINALLDSKDERNLILCSYAPSSVVH